jgi:hypothetical protein
MLARTHQFQRIELPLDRADSTRKIGMGARYRDMGAEGKQRFIAGVGQAMQAPTYQLPTIESVRIHYGGPLTDEDISAAFGATIDPLGSMTNTPPPGALSVETTMAQPGQLQTWALILAIGWQLEPEPLIFEAQGNAWTTPTVGTVQPISPDAFSAKDLNTSTGTLGLTGSQVFVPAVMEHGWWTEKAFWHMTRGYNLQWQWGNNATIINDSLRFTAFTPSNGMQGASSSSEIDTEFFIRQMNNYYVNELGSPVIMLPIDRARIGNMTLGGNAGLSVYRPTRAYEKANATYGGMGLRSDLRANTEFRRLHMPFLLKPGVPIGLKARVYNTDDQIQMQQYLSATCGLGGPIPADFTSYANVSSGNGVTGTAVIGAEPSLDNPVAPEGITTITDRMVFKSGTWKLTVALKGFELTDDQAEMIRDGGFRAALTSSCNCQIPS